MKRHFFFSMIRKTVATAGLLATLTFTSPAKMGMPVSVSLASADAVRSGEPINIVAYIQPGTDFAYVKYEVLSSTEWQIIDGSTQWTGALQKGQMVELRFRAIPLTADPEPLKASVSVPGQPAVVGALTSDRLGGKFPEIGREEASSSKEVSRQAAEAVRVQYEPGVDLPTPMAATEPTVPGQERKAPRELAMSKSQRRAASLVANGQFTYLDNNSVRHGVRNATVEIYNQNPAPSFGDELCGRGITDGDGNFSVEGQCGDLFDGPDVFAKIVLNNSVVEVTPNTFLAGTYTFATGVKQNSSGGSLNFGQINITSNQKAFQAHNLVMRAQQFMATQGESLSKINVKFPDVDGTFYSPFFKELHIEANRPFGDEFAVFHEYGHHILETLAENPSPDYDNDHCDTPDPGHCLFEPEKGAIAWTEGWPDFFGQVMHSTFRVADSYGAASVDFENTPHPFAFPGEEDHTEGIVAGILWDLFDTQNDDQENDGAGRRDNISLSFATMWNVVKNFDPSGNIFHNHPTDIHEFWLGLHSTNLGSINKVSEAYREHHIIERQPDLEVTAVQAAPTNIDRGATFSNVNTVRNSGDIVANASFTVRFRLNPVVPFAVIGSRPLTPVTLATRTVAAGLAAGASSNATTSLTIPATMLPGSYILQVCADSTGQVPESDETNNCRNASGSVVVE